MICAFNYAKSARYVILEDGRRRQRGILSKKVNMALIRTIVVLVLISLFYTFASGEKEKKEKEKTKIGKDVLDYTESDIYRLAEQWDVSLLSYSRCCRYNYPFS